MKEHEAVQESGVSVGEVRFADEEADIRRIRNTVFSKEQGIDAKLDFDGRDGECIHVLAREGDGDAVGTARMMEDGHIGRIAVLAERRGRGIGRRLTLALVEAARRRAIARVYLHSQVHAVGFYEALGFRTSGPVFMEAGIEHVRMERQVEST
ncbi:MAG: GNAT family N-acetyltransferase [Gammaproteobacteria bacterium]|nr:GNAT family N-acetyltransferase [Gammaproteobacteria bacterium]